MTNKTSNEKPLWKTLLSAISTGILLSLFVLSFLLFAVPKFFGGNTFTILTQSMEPSIQPGDVIITLKTPAEEILINDVITFLPKPDDPTLITHRVLERKVLPNQGVVFTTKGDNNSTKDKEPVLEKQVVGKVFIVVPKIGFVFNFFMSNPWALLSLVVLLFGYAIYSFVKKDKKSEDGGDKNSELEEKLAALSAQLEEMKSAQNSDSDEKVVVDEVEDEVAVEKDDSSESSDESS